MSVNETPDYSKYTLHELYDAYKHIDRALCPDRFLLLANEIWKREREMPATQDNGEASIANSSERPKASWKIRDIFLGILLILCYQVVYFVFATTDFFQCQPWLTYPIWTAYGTGFYILLTIYAAQIFKARSAQQSILSVNQTTFLRESLIAVWYLLVILVALTLLSIIFDAIFAVLKYQWSSKPSDNYYRFVASQSGLFFTVFGLIRTFTLTPIAEEFFHRGFLYNALKSRFPINLAIVVQAAIFALCHNEEDWHSYVTIFCLGVALAIVYEKRKTLLTSIIIHAMKNAMAAIPLLILVFLNYHVPAKTWDEANMRPSWYDANPGDVEYQIDGELQWQYAVNSLGSKGSKRWKKEINALNAVCEWFPEDRAACAKARSSVASVYYVHLSDNRRAIVEADRVLSDYPDQSEQCVAALGTKGWSYYMLKDFKNSRESFDKIIEKYKEYKTDYRSAQEAIRRLDVLEKKMGE